MNRTKNVFMGISRGVVNNILNILLPFICRTIIIRKLGIEYVGLKGIFTSILQVLSLSELGFGASIGYMLYKPLADKDVNKVNAILKFYRFIYRIIGLVVLGISVILMPFLDKLIADEVPKDINLYVLFCLYVANTVVSYFFFAYKRILLSANQRYDIEVGINSVILIVQNALQILALLTLKSYYAYVVLIPLMTIVNNFVAYYVVNKKYPEYKCKGELEKSDIRGIIKNTSGAFFSKIGSTVYLSVDSIVISAVLGLVILGIYDNYYYVISSIVAVFAVIHNTIRPVVGNIIAVETKEKVWSSFRMINYVYMLLVIICSTCVYYLIQDFEFLWGGEKNLFGIGTVVLLVCFFYSGRLGAVLIVYQEASGLFWQGRYIPLISAAINLLVNILLVNIIGLPGVLISSIVSTLFISIPGYTYIIFKHLFDNSIYLRQFVVDNVWFLIQLGICLTVGSLGDGVISASNWGGLVLKGVIYLLTVGVVLFVINIKSTVFREFIGLVFCKIRLRKHKIK